MTPTHATVRPLATHDAYRGQCGLCRLVVWLEYFDLELPLGSQHLCSACCQHVITADAALNGRQGMADAAPLARPPLGCEADGDARRR